MTAQGKIQGWQLHRERANPETDISILPPRGLHVRHGQDARINTAIAADLTVALAAGPMG